MIEIKGNEGKSRIFEELMTSDTFGIIIDNSFRNVSGDKVFIIEPEVFDQKIIIGFMEDFPWYAYNKIMVYTNFDYEKIKPIIDWMEKKERQNFYLQCIVFYKG